MSRYHPVDVYVGNKIRETRWLAGLSQTALGMALGLSFQQIQKYEKGANRVSASKLYEIGQVLKVGPAYFFEGYDEGHEFESVIDGPTLNTMSAMSSLTPRQMAAVASVIRVMADDNEETAR